LVAVGSESAAVCGGSSELDAAGRGWSRFAAYVALRDGAEQHQFQKIVVAHRLGAGLAEARAAVRGGRDNAGKARTGRLSARLFSSLPPWKVRSRHLVAVPQ